jgi:hypothetical protein
MSPGCGQAVLARRLARRKRPERGWYWTVLAACHAGACKGRKGAPNEIAGFAAIAKGFGLRRANVTSLDQFASLLRGYEAAVGAEVWNIPISDKVVSIMQARQARH